MTRFWRIAVPALCVGLLAVHLWAQRRGPQAEQIDAARLVIGAMLSAALLLRPRPPLSAEARGRRVGILLAAAAGATLSVAGSILGVGQFEWLGLLLLAFACFAWALPAVTMRDAALALFLFYLVHPLPARAFAPLQLWLQYVSVQGAEWLLHCVNIRAWGDGHVLRLPTVTIGVPEACSGIRTALTVLVAAFGTALLLRLRRLGTAILVLGGIAQVVVLNALRIALVARFAPGMTPARVDGVLHDTLSLFLLAAMALVAVEASLLRVLQSARDVETMARAKARTARQSQDTAWWFQRSRVWLSLAAAVAVLVGSGAALYKRRPYHRSEMIAGIVDDLAKTDLEQAERAARAAVNLNEGSEETQLKLINVLLWRGKYEEALGLLSAMKWVLPDGLTAAMKAWAVAGMGRIDEAEAILNALPEETRNMPGVAMLRAEIAAVKDDPRTVVENVLKAAAIDSVHMLHRVRALYPYLAGRQQWNTIVKCQRRLPYGDVTQALIAVVAHLRMDKVAEAGLILKRAAETWPDDPRLLGSLLSMAILKPDGDWQKMFADSFRRHAATLEADQLATCLGYSFSVGRSDLASLAGQYLRARDGRDPALYLVVALAAPVGSAERSRELALCIDELQRREKEGEATARMQLMHPTVLAMAGSRDAALAKLDELEAAIPARAADFAAQRAAIFDASGEWDNSYEAARRHMQLNPLPDPVVTLMYVRALTRLGFGIHALPEALRVAASLPDSLPAQVALASAWEAAGMQEEALFVLGGIETLARTPVLAGLLWETGRFAEAKKLAMASGTPSLFSNRPVPPQSLVMPMAELTVLPPSHAPLSDAEMGANAARLDADASRTRSPFFRNLKQLAAVWYKAHGGGKSSDLALWLDVGRDDTERSIAAAELGLLLARRDTPEQADEAFARAVALRPGSPLLWRERIALTGGRSNVIEQAAEACPGDGGVWLAGVVVRARDRAPEEWADKEVGKAINRNTFSPGVFVKAGDFLWRAGMTNAAAMAAAHAMKTGRGLLPASVLGLRCAVSLGDLELAAKCAQAAAAQAVDPAPFDRAIVELKIVGKNVDGDLISALEQLHIRFPDDSDWSRLLAAAYFRAGRTEDFRGVLWAQEEKNGAKAIGTLLLEAEAARADGSVDAAIRLLEQALDSQPGNLSVLNSLIYCLAQTPANIPRALELLPRLEKQSPASYAVWDTMGLVHMKAGELDKARECITAAVAKVTTGDYAWQEVYLNAVELDIRLGRLEDARKRLEVVRSQQHKTGPIERRIWELLVMLDQKGNR